MRLKTVSEMEPDWCGLLRVETIELFDGSNLAELAPRRGPAGASSFWRARSTADYPAQDTTGVYPAMFLASDDPGCPRSPRTAV